MLCDTAASWHEDTIGQAQRGRRVRRRVQGRSGRGSHVGLDGLAPDRVESLEFCLIELACQWGDGRRESDTPSSDAPPQALIPRSIHTPLAIAVFVCSAEEVRGRLQRQFLANGEAVLVVRDDRIPRKEHGRLVSLFRRAPYLLHRRCCCHDAHSALLSAIVKTKSCGAERTGNSATRLRVATAHPKLRT